MSYIKFEAASRMKRWRVLGSVLIYFATRVDSFEIYHNSLLPPS